MSSSDSAELDLWVTWNTMSLKNKKASYYNGAMRHIQPLLLGQMMEIMVFSSIYGLSWGFQSSFFIYKFNRAFRTGAKAHNTCLWAAIISTYDYGTIWPCTGYIMWHVCVCARFLSCLFRLFMSQDKSVLSFKIVPAAIYLLSVHKACSNNWRASQICFIKMKVRVSK